MTNLSIMGNKYSISNILGNQKKNNEVYTPSYVVEELLKIIKLEKSKIIWCPFDKEDELAFYKVFKQHGYHVICTHIDDGKDFYKYEPKFKFDIIISNPPFSTKRLLIERCESFKKDFILLYGCTIFSQSMGNTLNRCRFYFIQKNIKFTTKTNEKKSFQCCWLFNKNNKLFR